MSGAQPNNQVTTVYFLCQNLTLGPSVQYNLLKVTKQHSDPEIQALALKPKIKKGFLPGSKFRTSPWALLTAVYQDRPSRLSSLLHGRGQQHFSCADSACPFLLANRGVCQHGYLGGQKLLLSHSPPAQILTIVYVKMDVQFFLKIQIAGPWKGKECWKKGDMEPKEGQPRALIVLEHLDGSHLLSFLLGRS